jgi:cytochrome oxidase assembly protein ShyY1
MVLVGLRNPPGGGVQGGELGYIVLSPFMSSDGRLVLANRGWIPKSLHRNCQGDRVEIAKKVFCKVDRVDIEGVFQKGDNKPLGFIGNSKSNDIQWIWLDEDSIKREILKETQINSSFERDVFRVTKDSGNCLEGKLPMHLDAQSILASPSSYLTPTKHLVYCGTWFSLAAAISILTWRWGRTRPKSFAWKKS